MRYAEIGSVSSGTLRTEDLLEAFADELEYQLKRQPRSYPRKEARNLIREAYRLLRFTRPHPTDCDPSDIVNELQDALQDFAPPYCYFGAHCGDGADFGYWSDWEDTFEDLKVDDLSEIPKGYRGEVMHITDHGNATLYVVGYHDKLREVWSIV